METSIFSFSSQCFLSFPEQISIFWVAFILSTANAFKLDIKKMLSFGKELNVDKFMFSLRDKGLMTFLSFMLFDF